MSDHRAQGDMEQSRRDTGQGSIFLPGSRIHMAHRSRHDKMQGKTKERQSTKSLKGNRETRASCLVIIVIVGYYVSSSGM